MGSDAVLGETAFPRNDEGLFIDAFIERGVGAVTDDWGAYPGVAGAVAAGCVVYAGVADWYRGVVAAPPAAARP
ncbi:MAG: hypothetical protein VX346_11355 [Planctomycetota bacterium]|nr:hypothetical protein [Planctomycetota bacterium]